ncbi:rod shape-determining protein MreD [Lachnobacterium bovis]|uniref:Rod shape-determining protein MreD n=1 Tax=Lachnobacterium bovis TaxID=140626 RepID=A0A1H9PYW0_9FIRM|nr:rod shape-determining protein MreD [Lachnobacterium bovis]SER53384.1 rod shape-determining protein MreD [Lachnobacterium bovis]
MRRKVTLFLLISICFVLQTTICKSIAFADIAPNLLLIVIATFGFMRGRREGMFIGALSGLLVDIFFGPYLGLNTLLYMYIGYINGLFKKYFYPDDINLPLILIAGSDWLLNTTLYLFVFIGRRRFDYFYYLKTIIVPEMVYSTIVTVFVFFLLVRLNEWIEKEEKRRAKNIE